MAKYMKQACMKDVARVARVSQATVSYVVNGRAAEMRIPPRTVERVQQVCRELGYRRDYLATAMITKRTRVVGVLFANALGSFMAGIIRGARDVLREQGRQVVLCTCGDDVDVEAEDLDMLVYRHVDGIISFPVWCPDRVSHWTRFRENGGAPVVFIDYRPRGVDGPCVGIDDARVGREAAERLARTGVRTPVLLKASPDSAPTVTAREEGFLAGVRRTRMRKTRIVPAADTAAVADLFRSAGPGDGVFAAVTGYILDALLRQDGPPRTAAEVVFASVGLAREAHFLPNRWWMAEQPEESMGGVAAQHLLLQLGERLTDVPPLCRAVTWHLSRRGAREAEPSACRPPAG